MNTIFVMKISQKKADFYALKMKGIEEIFRFLEFL